ncbi:MAG TPA: GtrA family protein [Kiritimatiellia bacterium]|nr:GtrA family protein [Kiritimatiellia bacterium]HRZ11137.1 GtrA family protein [Kiritimatiellia bacterium]HSA19491.1 GtrA family protein [Kiritimatiellia bacterium]
MKHIIRQFFQREASPFVQFIKYALCGGMATLVDIVLFNFLAWKVFPALGPEDPLVRLLGLDVAPVDDLTREHRYYIIKVITFFFGNLTAYILNVLWVFKPGRHSRLKEILLFYLVSIISWGIGTVLGGMLIRFLGWETTVVYLVNMATSLMINFVCRKYIIFKG